MRSEIAHKEGDASDDRVISICIHPSAARFEINFNTNNNVLLSLKESVSSLITQAHKHRRRNVYLLGKGEKGKAAHTRVCMQRLSLLRRCCVHARKGKRKIDRDRESETKTILYNIHQKKIKHFRNENHNSIK